MRVRRFLGKRIATGTTTNEEETVMDPGHRGARARAAMLLASLLVCTLHPVVAGSVELTDMKGT